MERLQKKRTIIREATERLFVQIRDSIDRNDVEQIEELLAIIEIKERLLDKVDTAIEEVTKDQDLCEEMACVEVYQNAIVELRVKARRCLDTAARIPANEPVCHANRINDRIIQGNVRLPKLSIQKFNGDISNWQSFYDTYSASVHTNVSLSKVEKFSYLKSYLDGPAASMIMGLALTEANYDAAMDLLIERFGRKEILISNYMTQLLNVKPVKRSNDVTGLRVLYDTCVTLIRGLESLDIKMDSYASLLCPVLLKIIPADMVVLWNRENTENNFYNVEPLMKFIKREVTGRERSIFLNTTLEMEDETGRGVRKVERGMYSAASLAIAGNENPECLFCNGIHKTSKCEEEMDVNVRVDMSKKAGCCFLCFGKGHLSRTCKERFRCEKCNGKHNTLICFKEARKPFSRNDELVLTNMSGASHSTQPLVSLQTIRVRIIGLDGKRIIRCLLDTGSHRTFITKRIVEELNLKEIGAENLRIETFGGKKEIHHKRKVMATLQHLENPKVQIIVDALVSEKICTVGNIDVDETLRQILVDSGISLNDIASPDSNDDHIDLLVGSDVYWKIVTGNIKRITDTIVTIESKFGFHPLSIGQQMYVLLLVTLENQLNAFGNLNR